MESRLKGVVIKCDGKSRKKIEWKVRVEDGLSLRNGLEFSIASTHDNIRPIEGLFVEFLIGTIGENGGTVEKAIEVRPVDPPTIPYDANGKKEQKKRSELWEIVEQVNKGFPGQDVNPLKQDSLPGKGGMKHKYLQKIVHALGERHGYKTTIEGQIPGTSQSVDVILEKGEIVIGCEIAVTNVYKETGNLDKCIRAGYRYVVCLATERRVLDRVKRNAISTGLDIQRVQFFLPEEFSDFLKELELNCQKKETTRRGYRVKIHYTSVTPEEARIKQETIARIIAESILKQRRAQARSA